MAAAAVGLLDFRETEMSDLIGGGRVESMASDHDMLVRLVVLTEGMQRDLDGLRRDFDRDGNQVEGRLASLERLSISRTDVEKMISDLGVVGTLNALREEMKRVQVRLAYWAGGITVGGLIVHFALEWLLRQFHS